MTTRYKSRRRGFVGKRPEPSPSLGVLNSLYGKRYVGYFSDNVSFFNTANLHGDISVTSQISSFSSSSELYSWMWMGMFRASATGTWTFYTNSDDASYLWLGNNAISGYTTSNSLVNNGGAHAAQERSGTVSLTSGEYYPIRIMFGENTGGEVMTVSFAGPGVSKTTNGLGYYFDGLYAWNQYVEGIPNSFPSSDPGIVRLRSVHLDKISE
jgi:hypothetical protein